MVANGRVAALIDDRTDVVWLGLPDLAAPPWLDGLLDPEGGGRCGFDVEGHAGWQVRAAPPVLRTRIYVTDGVAEVIDHAPPGAAALVRDVRIEQDTPSLRLRLVAEAAGRCTVSGPGRDDLLAGTPLRGDVRVVLHAPEQSPELPGPEAAQQDHADWIRPLRVPRRWREACEHALWAVRSCCLDETGAIVAALTTSIPEAPDSGRCWDYRYSWLRDAWFAHRELVALGETRCAGGWRRWLRTLLAGGTDLQPLYGVRHERELTESINERLRGYRGMGPVRWGNAAWHQVQHDVWANVILALEQGELDEPTLEQLEVLGEHAWRAWDRPDAGMWELRGIAHVHTVSAAFCQAALAGLARLRGGRWAERAEQVRARTLERAWNAELGGLSATFEAPVVDAGLLLLPGLGLIEARDPRFTATLDLVLERLGWGPHLKRYDMVDDFGEMEVAFTICGFWAVEALALAGRVEEAVERFEALLACRNRFGLYAEDLDPATGEHWGNFPQLYSHVGVLRCARLLSGAF